MSDIHIHLLAEFTAGETTQVLAKLEAAAHLDLWVLADAAEVTGKTKIADAIRLTDDDDAKRIVAMYARLMAAFSKQAFSAETRTTNLGGDTNAEPIGPPPGDGE